MGLDLSYFDNVNIDNNELNKENISIIIKILKYFIYFLVFFGFLGFYNSSIFGMVLNPLYFNFIFMSIIMINIFINIKMLANKNPLFLFNISYFVILFILFIIIQFIIYYFS